MKYLTIPIVIIVLSIATWQISYVIGAEKYPIVSETKIIFSNGKQINYSQNIIFSNDVSEAGKQRKPVSAEEQPILVESWSRILLEKKLNYFEDVVKEIAIYDYDGNKISAIAPFFGDTLILLRTNRILVLQKSAHHQVSESYILNSDGQNIASVKHSANVISSGRSKDDLTWWMMTSGLEGGKPFVTTCIYDFDGNEIGQFKNFTQATVSYTFRGMIYTINSPTPEPPG